MKKISIKKKLTLWYTVIILLVGSVLFVSFYFLTNRYLIYETDRSLILHSSQIAYNMGTNTNNLHSSQAKGILDTTQKETPGIFVQIVDTQGNTTEGIKSGFASLAQDAVKANNPKFIQTKINDFSMRYIAFPIVNNNSIIGTVIMGHQVDVYEKTLSQLRSIGLIILVFLILPAILVGYWLSASATDPVKKLGVDITKINSENLSRHIDVKVTSEETDILVTNFNSMLDRLSSAFNLERQFLGEMAHEIKTPLAVIKSNSEVILSKMRTAIEYQISIQQTLDQIDKLTKNLTSLMDFAWAQSQDAKFNFTVVDLSQLLNELSEVARYMASPKEIDVKKDIQDRLFTRGKEEKLYQALYNIVENAIKFTPSGGAVEINLTKKENTAVIEIIDNGIGIDKEHQQNIFNRFFRSEEDKNIAGHGLGLAIADSIIKAHDGKIEIDSEKDKGSIFRIILGLTDEQES